MTVEYTVIIPDYEMLQVSYINTEGNVYIFSSIFNENVVNEVLNSNIVINSSITNHMERIQKTHSKYKVLPLFYSLGDADSLEVGFSREQREHLMVLPFGSDSQTPRKQPTELIYRAKKMKNKFTID